MTVNEYYRYYLAQLQHIYSPEEAAVITGMIFENKLSLKKSDIIKFPEQGLPAEQTIILDDALRQLLLHKPVQYITGESWFYNLNLKVNEHVLIPRPETEELVKWIIDDHFDCKEKHFVIDIGTGSGCIAIALKKNLPQFDIDAIDISNDALDTAKQNAVLNNAAVDFIMVDLLDDKAWEGLPLFDIIVSNPPYIPVNEKEKLDSNVAAYEPHLALFVPDNNPLLFYETIARFAKIHLNENGKIYVEIHEDYPEETSAVFFKQFNKVEIRKDINGKERMIKATNSLL